MGEGRGSSEQEGERARVHQRLGESLLFRQMQVQGRLLQGYWGLIRKLRLDTV